MAYAGKPLPGSVEVGDAEDRAMSMQDSLDCGRGPGSRHSAVRWALRRSRHSPPSPRPCFPLRPLPSKNKGSL